MIVTHVLKTDQQYPQNTKEMKNGEICTCKRPDYPEEVYLLKSVAGFICLNNAGLSWPCDLAIACYVLPAGSKVTLTTSIV